MTEVNKSKKTRTGIVVSTKMDKTVVVRTERIMRHKLYGKFIRRHEKYLADDPTNSCGMGDKILIEECRPLSKHKRWRVREILEKAV